MSKKQKDAMNNPETVAAAPTDPPPAAPETDKPAAQVEAKPAAATPVPPPQKPSIGRMVHYYPKNAPAGKKCYPATITHVNDNGTVNLHVCNDGAFRLLSSSIPVNVPLQQNDEEAEGYWAWPPRV